jgi:transcriptional regulator with XRE-family HTH domain
MAKKKANHADAAHKRTTKTMGIQGARVREARVMRGWTRFELARRSNIQPSALSGVELGHKDMNGSSIVALAKALDVSADFLLGLSSESSRK